MCVPVSLKCYIFAIFDQHIQGEMKIKFVHGRQGNSTVEVSVASGGERKYKSTKVYIPKSNWSTATSRVIKRNDAVLLNGRLDKIKQALKAAYDDLYTIHRTPTASELLSYGKGKGSASTCIYDYGMSIISTFPSSRRLTLQGALKRFKNEFGDLVFEDFKFNHAEKFKKCLISPTDLKTKGLQGSTANLYLYQLSSVFSQAINDEIISVNYFGRVGSIKHSNNKIKYVTKSDVSKLISVDLGRLDFSELGIKQPTSFTMSRFEKLRKYYIFCCVVGLRKSDMIDLDFNKHIIKNSDGTFSINKILKKTRNSSTIRINFKVPKLYGNYANTLLQQMIDSNEKFDESNFSKGSTTILKSILKQISGKDDLTFHSSRHTCATTMYNLGLSKDLVAKMLGHTTTEMTSKYAKLFDETLNDGLEQIG